MNTQLLENEHYQKITMSIPNQVRVRDEMMSDFDRIKDKFCHVGALVKSLLKQLPFSQKLNFSAFREIHGQFEGAFKAFFGPSFSAETLFEKLDEDGDKYLNEDEQLSIFTVLNSKLMFFYQEFIYLGCYDRLKDLEQMQDQLLKQITFFQTNLRAKMYEEQDTKFEQIVQHKQERLREEFQKRELRFQEFKRKKVEECE